MREPEEPSATARILHIAQTTAGGIASYFEEIAGYQAERYGRDNVAFLIPSGAEHRPKIDPAMIRTFGSASRGPAALLSFARSSLGAIQQFKPDIIHLHSSFAGAIIRAMLAFRRKRPRVIYCPHGWAFSMEISDRRKRAYAAIERCLSRGTDLIHNVSHSEQQLAIDFGLPAAKTRVLVNGIARTPTPRRKARSGPLRFLFIGRHDRQKGLDILLDTIEHLPLRDMHFDIVGSGIVSGGVVDRPKAQNVTFYGWLARESTLQLLDHADALIMPSRWDAAPIVALEAMREGVPIIGSNRGAIPEIVVDGVGGRIFDLDDRDSLSQLLQELDRAGLDRLGRTARKRFETRYTADRMNVAICDAYDAIRKDRHGLSRPSAGRLAVSNPSAELST